MHERGVACTTLQMAMVAVSAMQSRGFSARSAATASRAAVAASAAGLCSRVSSALAFVPWLALLSSVLLPLAMSLAGRLCSQAVLRPPRSIKSCQSTLLVAVHWSVSKKGASVAYFRAHTALSSATLLKAVPWSAARTRVRLVGLHAIAQTQLQNNASKTQ